MAGLVGALLSGLSAAGNSVADSASTYQKFSDQQSLQASQEEREGRLARLRSDLDEQRTSRIEEARTAREQAPLQRFSKIAQSYVEKFTENPELASAFLPKTEKPAAAVAGEGVPIPEDTDTSGDWNSINASFKAGEPERNDAQRAILQAELDKETDPENVARLKRELSRVGAGASADGAASTGAAKVATDVAKDAASITQDAIKKAAFVAAAAEAKISDPVAYKAAFDAFKGEHTYIGPSGALVNALSGEEIYRSHVGEDIANKRMESNERVAGLKARVAENIANKKISAAKAKIADNPDATLDDDTVRLMAQQYNKGDTSVMQNLGRGAQGSENIIKLRKEITRQTLAAGEDGGDRAAKNAEYFGTKAGQRAAGTRIANVEMASSEAESLIPLARIASESVNRPDLLPFGKAAVIFDEQTNNPELRKFAAANNALVNVYSRAISPSGVPTVADKEHAREMISTAMNNESYQAVLDQMQMEITAARAAPKTVRKAFSDEVTGRGDHAAPNPVAAQPTASGVPAAAAAYLKANPALSAQFDAKYGAGASKQILGR